MNGRRIALACLTPRPDGGELGPLYLPSYGIRRIQAAVLGDPALAGVRVGMVDLDDDDLDAYVDAILAQEPEIVGFSVYVWSAAFLVATAREVKRRRPAATIVFGGPSARAAVFDLPLYSDPAAYLDAVVEGDGEVTFRELAALPVLSRAALEKVAGLTLPERGGGWRRTAPRGQPHDLDSIASPFQLGLMPHGGVAYLETFRGCPLSCRFCEWGAKTGTRQVFSEDYIIREMQSFEGLEAPAVFLLDAGLNLNARGFRNLRAANAATGFLRSSMLWAEIYPSVVNDEHLEFLSEVGPTYLGVGLQSMDENVRRLHLRPGDSPRFEAAVRQIASVSQMELQIIMGLPGDTPDGFRRTLDYACSLGPVRAYHCLVLPDALLTRGLPEFDMRFDQRTLAMQSCLGWSADDISSMREEMTARSRAAGGRAGDYWWSFPTPRSSHGEGLA